MSRTAILKHRLFSEFQQNSIKWGNMARITVEDCLDVVPNRFLLAMVAAKRSKQLFKGAQPLIENKSNNRKVVLALREIAAEKIAFEIPVRQQD
ncbi:MAG TPA: DNA-directed RNA polymerase subunit omega [Desulfuromonadales bacterium]|nr:DNA-directed RNA polymerase subunit omega [Desulfuromonadales bacterium]